MQQTPTKSPASSTAATECGHSFTRAKPFHCMTDMPWKDACALSVTPFLVLTQSFLEALGQKIGALEACKKRHLTRLFLILRKAGLEPLILTDRLPLSRQHDKDDTENPASPAEKNDSVQRFLKKALSSGARVCLVPPKKSMWQVMAELSTDNVLVLPMNYPFVRKSGLLLFLHEAAKRAGRKEGRRMLHCTEPLAASLYGTPGWPCLLDRKTLLLLAEEKLSFGSLQKSMPLFEAADSSVVRACDDMLQEMHLPASQFYETLEEDEGWLNRRDAARLLCLMHLPRETRAHSVAVSRTAWAIAQRMRLAGCRINPELAASSALLHDMAKGFRHHEKTGAMMLEGLGLFQMAHCIADHRDLVLADDKPVTEREVVYLADKYCSGSAFVPLEERFSLKKDMYKSQGRSTAGIDKRLQHAKALEERLTRETGVSPEHIARETLQEETI